MIDYIWLANPDYDLSSAKFGEAFLGFKSRHNDSFNYKYRLYKTDEEIVYLEDSEDPDEEEGMIVKQRSDEEPYLTLIVNEKKGYTIQGSIRRWYYGNGSWNKDFNYTDFLKCISLLSKQARIPEKILLQSSIVRVEIGANIILPASYKDVQSSITSFPRREKGWRNNTVYFNSTYSDIIFYDKLNSLKKERLMSKKKADSLLKKFYVLRFELNLRRAKRTLFKNEVKTLSLLKDNWEYLLDEWYRYFENVKFENKLPPKTPKEKEWLNYTEVRNFFVAYGIHHYGGLEAAHNLVKSKIPENNRPREFGKLENIVTGLEPINFKEYIDTLKEAVYNRMIEMKKGLTRK